MWPPKPNELDSATSTVRSTMWLGAQSRSHSGSGVDWLMVGGILPRAWRPAGRRRTRARRPRRAGGRSSTWSSRRSSFRAWSPNTALTACVSATSPCGVRGAVGVDVAHVLEVDLAVGRGRRAWRAARLRLSGAGDGDVIRVGAQAVAEHLAQDRGAARLGVLQALEHHDGRRRRPARSRRGPCRTGGWRCSGASLRVDSAFMFENAAIVSPVIAASAPPVIIASAIP